MARPKRIPDTEVFSAVLQLLSTEGDKSVSFARVGRLTGLAPATLVQRFRGLDRMMNAALIAGWDQADAALAEASAAAEDTKGLLQILKSLPPNTELLAASGRDEALRKRAADWRTATEAALAMRMPGKGKAAQSAAVLFAFWQGQTAWQDMGGKGAKLKDVLKRLL